ncbi:MAG: hypothetical protein HC771_09295 [Synechococcales cyanobacterium CRU_2_2]|nr:hypothetical protein [Synechococcales cyanobacterium CRU_2_2]
MGEWDNAEAESFDSWFQDDQVQGAQSLWQDLTAGYVLGNLSPDEAIAVQAYLAEHPDAVAELAQLQETLHVLPLALPETAEPPLALRDLVLQDAAAFGQESPVMLKQPRATRPLRQRSWVPWLGFSVAAGLAIAGGLTTRQLHQELRLAEQRLTQSESQAHQMRSHLAQLQSQLDPRLDTLALLQRANNRLLPLNGSGGLTATSSGSLVIAPRCKQRSSRCKSSPLLRQEKPISSGR